MGKVWGGGGERQEEAVALRAREPEAPSLAGREAPTRVGVKLGERSSCPPPQIVCLGGVLVKWSLETGGEGLGGELRWGPGNNRNQLSF